MKTIVLTVQPSSNYWRLGLYTNDSKAHFSHLESVILILTNDTVLFCKAACGTSRKKAFDFNSIELSKWITDNEFHNYKPRNPTKLLFKLDDKKVKTLTYIELETNP